MEPHFQPRPGQPSGFNFPVLPIVTPGEAEPRLSVRDKYGGLFYLGVIGLATVVALIVWFIWGAWSTRSVWINVYVLHDRNRSEADRVQAAYTLSRDPQVNQRQYWDMSLRRPLPALARYVLAEALRAEAVESDPRGYVLAVARSEGWPVWLRLLLARPLAYAAAEGSPIPARELRELRDRHYDPAIGLWVDFALAASRPSDGEAKAELARAASGNKLDSALARLLLEALWSEGEKRTQWLDEATRWLRANHPEAAKVWSGWTVERGRLAPVP
jgi:hypothetical protein